AQAAEMVRPERAVVLEVPGAQSLERADGGAGVELRVGTRPQILVEGLNALAVGFRDDLSDSESDALLDVGQVGEHVAAGPFARAERPREPVRRELRQQISHPARRLRQNLEGIVATEQSEQSLPVSVHAFPPGADTSR